MIINDNLQLEILRNTLKDELVYLESLLSKNSIMNNQALSIKEKKALQKKISEVKSMSNQVTKELNESIEH